MTSSLPNEPLWPRAGRSGISAADDVVVELRRARRERRWPTSVARRRRAARRVARSRPAGAQARGPSRVGRLGSVRGELPAPPASADRPQTLDPGEDAPLALVEPLLDVGREDVPAAGRPHAERDRDRVVRFVRDRDGDPLHPELLGAGGGPAVKPDRGLAGRHPLDLDVTPADPADAEAEDLRDRLLGRPPAGHRLGPTADVALFRFGQDPLGEARPELVERGPDAGHLDDVDAELGRPGRDETRGRIASDGSTAGMDPLLDRDRLGQVARLVDVRAARDRDVIREQLERDDRQDRR